MSIRQRLNDLREGKRKGIAVLIDPDKTPVDHAERVARNLRQFAPDLVLVGGSLITVGDFDARVNALRQAIDHPLVLFPGSPTQLTGAVDAVLLLSLLSGRNPELLIGQHVVAAPRIRELQLEAVATGYLLIDGGKPTTASYISGTAPIPRDKPEIAAATALAGQQLGMHCIYLDAGSGAALPVPLETIAAVRKMVDLPIIVGGGIRSRDQLDAAQRAGADLVVVGTALEHSPELIAELVA